MLRPGLVRVRARRLGCTGGSGVLGPVCVRVRVKVRPGRLGFIGTGLGLG